MVRSAFAIVLPAFLLVFFFSSQPAVLAQSLAFGTPPFSSVSGGPDTINLSNLGFVYSVPAYSRTGRAAPLSIGASFENLTWGQGLNVNNAMQWLLSFPPFVLSNGTGFVFRNDPIAKTCRQGDGEVEDYNEYDFTGYEDAQGNSHSFTLKITDLISDGTGSCHNPSQLPYLTGGAATSDGSDIGVTAAVSPYSATVFFPNGTVINGAPIAVFKNWSQFGWWSGGGPGATLTDSNGNYITYNQSGLAFTSVIDNLGTTAVTNANGTTVTYTPPAGGSTAVTLTSTTKTIQTAWGCPNVAEFPATSFSVLTKITLPDGSYYQITYEPTKTGSTNITGRIASVRLPTGGNISYTYTGGDTGKGIYCADGSTSGFTRQTPDGTSTYARSNVVVANGNSIIASTTTVTDPQGNTTVVDFGGNLENQRRIYTGAATGTPIEATVTCYNGVMTNCATRQGEPGFSITPAEVTVFRSLNGGAQSEVDTFYDGLLVTAKNEYDFGVSTPSRMTAISYDQTIGNDVSDRPSVVRVSDGSGNPISETDYTYDEDEVAGTLQASGASQLSPVTCTASSGKCRGNATTIKTCVSFSGGACSSYLTRTAKHYDTGQVYQATDVSGAQSTYTYAACGNSLLTNVSLPMGLSESYGWNCTGAVMTSATDANTQSSYTNYTTDPYFWRPESTKDQLSNISNLRYPSLVQTEGYLNFNGTLSTVESLTSLDSMGRTQYSQRRQAQGSTNFDSTKQTYDSDGRPYTISMPYVGTAKQDPPGGTAVTTTLYDGASRPISVADGGGGTVSYTYTNNDVLQTIGPAPSGENMKSKQFEYDGLGRLTSVCEITSAPGSGTCGQANSKTGFWTRYKYDTAGHLIGVCQNTTQPLTVDCIASPSSGQQTRTYAYDGLGRLVQETNPENGTTNYTYDASSGCPGSVNGYLTAVSMPLNGWCIYRDSLGRVTKQSASFSGSGTTCQWFFYDNSTGYGGAIPSGVTINNPKGRLVEAATDNCSGTSLITDEWFSYSVRGELTDVYESTPHSGGYYHTTAAYWANGALQSLGGIPGLTATTYGVDGEGRPTSAAQGTTYLVCDTTCSPASTTFNAAGQVQTVNLGGTGNNGSGDNDTYTYDPSTGRMTNYSFTVGSTPKTMAGTLNWNANGTLRTLAITDGFNAGGTETCNYGTASVTGYDDLGRLLNVNCGTPWSQSFSYDQFGNITKSGSISWQPGYNSPKNQYTSPANCISAGGSPCYNADGNLLRDTLNSYTWTAFGKVATVAAGNTAAVCGTSGTCITYDASGRAVETNAAGIFTEILYGPIGKLATLSGSTVLNAYIPMPGSGSVRQTPTTRSYQHMDWLGMARLESGLASRNLTYDRAFAPFGEAYATVIGGTSNQEYAGLRQDIAAGNGLFDTPNREYPANQGRWISVDPAGFAAVNPANPQTWNRYAYVSNNPLNFVDPSGLVHQINDCLGCVDDNFGNPNAVTYEINGVQVSAAAFSQGILGQGGSGLEFAFDPNSGIGSADSGTLGELGSWNRINWGFNLDSGVAQPSIATVDDEGNVSYSEDSTTGDLPVSVRMTYETWAFIPAGGGEFPHNVNVGMCGGPGGAMPMCGALQTARHWGPKIDRVTDYVQCLANAVDKGAETGAVGGALKGIPEGPAGILGGAASGGAYGAGGGLFYGVRYACTF